MVLQRISLITIGAFNLPILRSFYKSLGWEETETSSDNYAAFKQLALIFRSFLLRNWLRMQELKLLKV